MTDKKKISDLRSMLAPQVTPAKDRINWLDENGKPLQLEHTDESEAGKKAAARTHAKNDQTARQPEVAPEKLRKHAT